MVFPQWTPDYAKGEFIRLMDIWEEEDKKIFDKLNKWISDPRMKFIYKSLEKSPHPSKGYFILAMLDSFRTDLDKFKREDVLTEKKDKKILETIIELKKQLSDRIELNDYAPDHYYKLRDLISNINLGENIEVFIPNMVKQANATRQIQSPTKPINKKRYARALITNLADNGFDVSNIKNAITEALSLIYDDSENPFSTNDVVNGIKDLRKWGKLSEIQDSETVNNKLMPPILFRGDESQQDGKIKQGLENLAEDELRVIRITKDLPTTR